jgi:DNA polymerase-1
LFENKVIYGMSAKTFLEYSGLDITIQEAMQYREAYFRLYPNVRKFHMYNSNLLEKYVSIEVKTLGGRISKVNKFTNANNYATQGTGADILKKAIILFFKYNDTSAKIINLIHDEIILEADAKDTDKALEILEKSMTEALFAVGINYPKAVEGEILKNTEVDLLSNIKYLEE